MAVAAAAAAVLEFIGGVVINDCAELLLKHELEIVKWQRKST